MWPVWIAFGFFVVFSILALILNSVRDLEAGFILSRPGRKHASVMLQGPMGLAVRLLRATILSWAVGLVVLGISYGAVLGDLEGFFQSNLMFKKMLSLTAGYSMTETYLSMLMAILGVMCVVPPLIILLKIRGEETRGRLEHLISRAVSRPRILGNYLFIALLSSFVMLLLTTLSLWVSGTLVLDDPIPFGHIFKSSMVYLPASWIMLGITAFLIAYVPKAASLIWVYLAYSFFAIYFGKLLEFPEWSEKLTPYGHIPMVPMDDINYLTLFVLTLIAAVLIGASIWGYRQRDMET